MPKGYHLYTIKIQQIKAVFLVQCEYKISYSILPNAIGKKKFKIIRGKQTPRRKNCSRIQLIGMSKYKFYLSLLQFITMGGVQSRAQMIKRYNKIKPQKWDIIRKEGLTQIAVDEKGRQGQVSIIKIDPTKKLEEELEVYYYRRTFDGPLVKTYGAQSVQSKSTGVCGADNAMKVITERIIKRWGELPQLTFPQILYALTQALQGYQALFKQVGIFQVNHNMMGLNNHGDLHVWLNQNFADNNPALQKGVLYTTGTQSLGGVNTEGEMVKNILSLIEDKCEEGKYPQIFKKQIYESSATFKDALEYVDDHITKNKILVPTKIHPDNSKMYVSRRKMQVVSGSRVVQQQNNRVSPIKKTDLNLDYSIMSSANKQQKVTSKPFTNLLYQTTYVRNEPAKQVMTPKHVVFVSTSPINQSPSGYYTGSQGVSIPTNQQISKYTDLRMNPNIDVAESVYQRTPQSIIRSNQASTIKPISSNVVFATQSLSHEKLNEHQKIRIVGHQTQSVFTSSPNTKAFTINGATLPQNVGQVQTKIVTGPLVSNTQTVNKKTSVKFNYLASQAEQNQQLAQRISITSVQSTNQINPGSNDNKITMETSQVKQY